MSRTERIDEGVIPTRQPKRGRRTTAKPSIVHPECLSDAELLGLVLEIMEPATAVGSKRAEFILAASRGIGGLGPLVNLQLHCPTETAEPLFAAPQLRHLAMVLELGRRAFRTPLVGLRVTSHRDVQRWAAGHLVGLEHEEVWVLAMKSGRKVEAEWCVARGGLHGCGLLPSDVLRPVLRCAASAFILVHNHPSGDPSPSQDDVLMTRALQQACLTVGVTLVDHVIVSRSGSYSLAEASLMNIEARWAAAE
jgi:DNA repair protein RadC